MRQFYLIFKQLSGDLGVSKFEEYLWPEVPHPPGLAVWAKMWKKYENIKSRIPGMIHIFEKTESCSFFCKKRIPASERAPFFAQDTTLIIPET